MHPSMTQQTISLYGDSPNTFSSTSLAFSRHVEGLTALLLSLKKKPIIRYEKMSGMARKLSSEILYSMESQKELWDFRKTQSVPLLLILDRRNDPVTPLLSQWTYQAMVHELIGIDNGRVNLSEAPDVRDEMRVSFFLSLSSCSSLSLSSTLHSIFVSSTHYISTSSHNYRKSYYHQIKIHSSLRISTIILEIWELIYQPTFPIIQINQLVLTHLK